MSSANGAVAALGESAPGHAACCWGMPDNLLVELLSEADMHSDTNPEVCCPALSASGLATVQEAGFCLDLPAPPDIDDLQP